MKRTDRSNASPFTYAILAAALVALSVAAHGQSIVAWGDNALGQCNVPPLPPNVVYSKVVAGDFFTAARRSDGYVVVWGDNSFGQTAVPPLPAGVSYVEVSAGGAHLLARRSDGVVVAWGDNTDGQCSVPAFPTGVTCVQVAAGGHHSLARMSDGSLLAWGRNVEGQCNVPPGYGPWTDVDGGGYHSIATDGSGHAQAWGLNTQGQCNVYSGNVVAIAAGGSQSLVRRDYYYNDTVLAWGVPAGVPTGTFAALAAGSGHSLFLKTDGTVIGIGLNNHGQCNAPPQPGSIYLGIAAGGGHSAAIVGPVPTPQSIVAWGRNDNGQCNVPPLPAGVVYAQVVAGDFFTAARRSDGSVVVWGDNFYGQTAVPPLPAGTTYVDLAAGAYHVLALRSDGAVVAWGANTSGQCNVPPLAPGVACVDVAAGGHHSLARLSNGSLIAWGLNAEGQCNVPPLPAGVTWTSVDGGGFHTIATRSDGFAAAWGQNGQGQCVLPPNIPSYLPYVAVAAGASHSLVLRGNGFLSPYAIYASGMAAGSGYSLYRRTDGTTLGVGLNDHGQCNVPPLQAGSIYAQLAAGNGHSAALVGPVAGSTSSGVGCGGPGPNNPLLATSAPVFGSVITFNLSYATPNASGFLYASPPAAPVTVSPGCVVRVDLATAVPVMPVTALPFGTGAPGFWTATVPVPYVPVLAGAQLALQIALLPTPTGFDLTNGVLITLGYDSTGPSGLCCQ